MIELPVTITSTGGAVSFASPVTLGYTKNKGVYRLLVTAEGEWKGLTIRCFWHLPGGTDPTSSLVQDGFVDVPASVTAHPGNGCITFEGSDGVKTVTSADLRYKVGSNSGTEDGTMPEPGAPAWEQLVSATKANADAAVQAKQDAETAAEEAENAATKAEEAASAAAKSTQKAEAAQKATEQAEAAAAESIAGAKKEALSAISAGEQGALGAVQQAQATATGAVQAAQTAAESAVSTAKTNAVQEVEAAAKPAQTAAAKAEEAADDAKRSAGIATGAADDSALNAENAQKSALSAQQSAENAAASQSAAQASADAAEKSQQSAATSEGNAAASAKKAQDVADSLPVDYTTAVNEIAALKTNKADKTELETVKQQVANITPDDSSIGDKPWSSKNIVDTLCPPLEESGNPVVCYPVAGYPLGVKAKWEPVQEGSGTPSPENIRPIKGRDSVTITRQEDNQVITLTLPETVYGGEVDAVRGEGIKNWERVVLDGTEKWSVRAANYTSYSLLLPMRSQTGFCTHYKKILYDAIRPDTGTGETGCYLEFSTSATFNVPFENVDDWKNYLAAQYAAGTPVYVVFEYANKVNEPFTATGAQPLPALSGTNTVLTDADSATVTGRADPIKRIEDLEAAVASIN